MNLQKINDLIASREKELAFLLEHRGTDFPIVERQNDLRIAFLELEVEDLKELAKQTELDPNQQIVFEWLKKHQKHPFHAVYIVAIREAQPDVNKAIKRLTARKEAEVLQAFSAWVIGESKEDHE